MATQTWVARDCARRLKVHYLLPAPIDHSFLKCFQADRIEVFEFSLMVDGAKDHFRVEVEHGVNAVGILGDPCVIVTYPLRDEGLPTGEIERFSNLLEAAGYGPVEAIESRSQKESGSGLARISHQVS